MFRTTTGVLLAGLLSACGDDAGGDDVQVPADWKTFVTDCSFSFRAPPDTSELAAQGDDSCVVRYQFEDCELTADYGSFSDPLTSYADEPDFKAETLEVDGKPARLISYRASEGRFAGIHVTEPDDDNEQLSVTVYATCATSAGQATALTLLQTLEFNLTQ